MGLFCGVLLTMVVPCFVVLWVFFFFFCCGRVVVVDVADGRVVVVGVVDFFWVVGYIILL